ncbi:MAG: acyltransferase domain-containing protein [Patulibacter minatonensis]
MTVVLLCPGQGQVPRDLAGEVRASGDDLCAAYEERFRPAGLEDPLGDYARQQAALVAVGVGRARRALALLGEPAPAAEYGPVVAVAGHSLGELTALFVSGAVDGPTAVRLAAARGAAFEAARTPAWDDAGMLAVSGPAVQNEIVPLIERHAVDLANDNAPDQVVVVGRTASLTAMAAEARELGLRAVRLETTGPSHSPYAAPAVAPYIATLRSVDLAPPAIPQWMGLTAAPVTDAPREIGAIIGARVRWREVLLGLGGLEPSYFLDIGPGGAMARLARKTVPTVATLTLDELAP